MNRESERWAKKGRMERFYQTEDQTSSISIVCQLETCQACAGRDEDQRRRLRLPEGQAQQEGPEQQARAGGRCPSTVVGVAPVALAPVGAVTVVGEAALHLGPRAAAVSLVAEILVCAGLHHRVCKPPGGHVS